MEAVEVRVRDCECPGDFHNGTGDVVFLRPKPSMALGLAVEADMLRSAASGQLLERAWAISYIRHGVTGWNFVDAEGKSRPLDVDELLDDFDMGKLIAEKADELYGDRVVTPFIERLFPSSTQEQPPSSPPGPTTDSTSPPPASPPRRSKRSSGATTAGQQ